MYFFYAEVIVTSLPDTTDAANITGHYSLDGSSLVAFATTNPTEIGDGVYWQPLAQVETDGNAYSYKWSSTTSGIIIKPLLGFTGQVQLADGVTHGGTTALFDLQNLSIINPSGDALHCEATGNNGNGINAIGFGSGPGIKITPGSTGHGIIVQGGSVSGDAINLSTYNGNGIYANVGNSGDGIRLAAISGHGLSAYSTGNDAVCIQSNTARGIRIQAATDGIYINAAGNGITINSTASYGIYINAAGSYGIYLNASYSGIMSYGGTYGMELVGNNGAGLYVLSYSGDAAQFYAGSNGTGLNVYGGQSAGDAIKLTNTNGSYGINGVASPNFLDQISIIPPDSVATNFREMIVQLWRRFFKKTVKQVSGLNIKTYADDNTTVVTTQTYTDDGMGNEHLGSAS